MKIVMPRAAEIVASNVPETDAPEWEAKAYTIGAKVMVSTTHHLYQALRATLDTENPPDHLLGTDPAWSDLGATNRFQMLDEFINTATSVTGLLDVTLTAGRCDSVGLFGCRGKTLTMDLISGGTVIWTQTVPLLAPTYTFTEYCFSDRQFVRDVFASIPIRGSSQLRIRIDAGEGGSAQCGIAVLGMAATLGETLWDVSPSRVSFSKKNTDDFGRTSLKKGPLAKYLKFTTSITTQEIDYVQKRLDAIDGIPCIFVAYGETGFQPEALLVYGFATQLQPTLPNEVCSTVSFEVEGLI